LEQLKVSASHRGRDRLLQEFLDPEDHSPVRHAVFVSKHHQQPFEIAQGRVSTLASGFKPWCAWVSPDLHQRTWPVHATFCLNLLLCDPQDALELRHEVLADSCFDGCFDSRDRPRRISRKRFFPKFIPLPQQVLRQSPSLLRPSHGLFGKCSHLVLPIRRRL
jgi:hypothetical protein